MSSLQKWHIVVNDNVVKQYDLSETIGNKKKFHYNTIKGILHRETCEVSYHEAGYIDEIFYVYRKNRLLYLNDETHDLFRSTGRYKLHVDYCMNEDDEKEKISTVALEATEDSIVLLRLKSKNILSVKKV